jgi:hypothetical protein
LVKVARQARARLAAGLPPDEVERFRRWVRRNVAQTEAICRERRATPDDLPTPSRRAYRFLKGIDLENLPLRESPAPVAAKTVRISGIVATQNHLNARMAEWAASESKAPTEDDAEVRALHTRLVTHTETIEQLAKTQGGRPGHLPTRSQRAYQWLKLLSDPATLVAHLKTVRALHKALERLRDRRHVDPRVRRASVAVHFGYQSYLYKAEMDEGTLLVTVHEGFMGASVEVLRALACMLLSIDRDANLPPVNTYAAGEDFIEIVTALEMTTADVEDFTRGRHFDLETVFDRVNAAHFAGEIARPRLSWNARITRAKMGHYDYFRDIVMLSVTLDAPDVPDFVIDYVMYHELLHKAMGAEVVNGRRYAHTPAFREAERKFPRYDEAEAFLQETAQKLSKT